MRTQSRHCTSAVGQRSKTSTPYSAVLVRNLTRWTNQDPSLVIIGWLCCCPTASKLQGLALAVYSFCTSI